MVNAKFEEKELTCRIDHRSYERQGLDTLSTIHEGVAVRQMEAKGIATDKGDLNRWIKAANKLLRDIRKKIAALTDWLKDVKAELSKHRAPNLVDLLNTYYIARNAGAWSNKAKVGNLKHFAEAVNYLMENGLFTLEDLETHLTVRREQTEAVNDSLKAMSAKKKELEDLLHYADLYQKTKPIYDEAKGIKWKSKREKFEAEHERDLNVFHMAHRKLEKHLSSTGEIPFREWRRELEEIQRKYPAEYERYKPMRDDFKKLLRVKNCVDTVLRQQEQSQEKHREVER